jgi:hypothetical protein
LDKKSIIEYLKENNLKDIEEIDYKEGVYVLRFFYDFDEDEIKAARAYTKDESEEEEESDIWYQEYFLPYLNDIAVDNVGDLIQDLTEKEDFEAQFVSYDLDFENYDYNEFITIFYNKGLNIQIEDILDELKI